MLLGGGNLNPKNDIVVLIDKINTLPSSKSPTRCTRSYFFVKRPLLTSIICCEPVFWQNPTDVIYNMYTLLLRFHDLIFGASLLVSHLCSPLPFRKIFRFFVEAAFCWQKSLQKAWNQKLHDFYWFQTCFFLGGRGGILFTVSKNIYPLVN